MSTRALRTTIVFGLFSAVLFVPMVIVFNELLPWNMARQSAWMLILGVYCLLLARWNRGSIALLLFPFLLLGLCVLYGIGNDLFFLLAMIVLGWVRSGHLVKKSILWPLGREAIFGLGGLVLAGVFSMVTLPSQALAIWLFFLVQSLIFLLPGYGQKKAGVKREEDRFEECRRAVKKLLYN